MEYETRRQTLLTWFVFACCLGATLIMAHSMKGEIRDLRAALAQHGIEVAAR